MALNGMVYYAGTTKAATEQGYERIDSTERAPGPFRDSCQSAQRQGWQLGQRRKNDAAREEQMRTQNQEWFGDDSCCAYED